MMKKRGLIVFALGLILVGLSFLIAMSALPSDLTGSDDLSVVSLFDGLFDEISDELHIVPDGSVTVSRGVSSSNVTFLWGVEILDYDQGDELSINISNIFGDDYGKFTQTESILFESLNISESDTLNFETKNTGTDDIRVTVMFSEGPENSDIFINPDFPITK